MLKELYDCFSVYLALSMTLVQAQGGLTPAW